MPRFHRRAFIAFLVSIFLAVVLAPGWARASCGSASCPAETAAWDERKAGEVTLSYDFEYADQDEHRIGTRGASFGEIRGHHDEEFTVNRTHRAAISVTFTDRLSADLSAPLVSRSHAHVHHHHGEDILESWDFEGLGDLRLLTRFLFWKPENPRNPALSVLLGGEFPTGDSDEANEGGDIAELGIQPGSNSYDLLLGLSSRQVFKAPMAKGGYGTLPFFVSLLGQLNGAGTDDYRLGDTLQVSAGTSYPLLPKVGLMGQVNFLLKDRDDKGRTSEEIQKTGGEFLYLSPGLEFRPTDNWRVYMLAQIPVYQRVNSIQVVSDYNLLFGAAWRFDTRRARTR